MTVKSSPEKLLRKLLGFKELTITWHNLMPLKGVLELGVRPHKNGACCPGCGRRCKLFDRGGGRGAKRGVRTWRDVPAGGLTVVLHYAPREILCPTHGRVQEVVPWAAPKARCTLRLECELMRLCKVMTQKEAAAIPGLPQSTAAGILHRTIARCREGHGIRGLKNIGIDEISYRRGHRYLTVVYDLDRNRVVWTGEGKGRATIDRFFGESMSAGQRARVKTACCDMSRAYMGAISDNLPNALLVLDRFHVIKALNEAIDGVRKEELAAADAAGRATLKGIRWALLKNAKNRTAAERAALGRLERANRRIFRACTLKDELAHFWSYTCLTRAEMFLKRWCKSALLSRLGPVRKFVGTLKRHWGGVFASVCGITNAAAEGINRLIRMAKNRASGYRSTTNFSNIIYLVVGDLDLPAQIPTKNRARQTKVIPHRKLCR